MTQWLGLAMALAASMVPVVTQAQELVPVEDPADRLDGWIERWAAEDESARHWVGGLGIAGGIGLGVVSAYMVAEQEPLWELYAVVGAVAVVDVALALVNLLMPSLFEERRARWRAARADGIDEPERARFEGEIAGEIDQARRVRWVTVGIGAGLAVAGAAGLGMTAGLAQDDVARVYGYGFSGGGLLLGAVLAIVSAFPSPREQEWSAYERGFGLGARVTPVVGPRHVGLGVSGQF